ncbi:CocE/NonD family hydrolase [Nocardia sp. CA-120079]|uniref:CocE/NonD family hydrolase n=1 Tax=Nocardia sp. CA-120079 TaxID=3239974 RepID=UPI003D96A036
MALRQVEEVTQGPKLSHRLKSAAMRYAPVRNSYEVTRGLPITLRDGVAIRADLYTPTGGGPFPSILIRTPYGRKASAASAIFFAARGYNVLVTASRGTDGSEGTFEAMICEADDGYDIVEWMRNQHWFAGRFATYGLSYIAYTQFALAEYEIPEWVAMIVAIGPHDFSGVARGRGVFDLRNFYEWSNVQSRRHDPHGPLYGMVKSASESKTALMTRALTDAPTAKMRELSPWYDDWVRNSDPADDYWKPYNHSAALERISRPVLLEGAWNDLFLRQTLTQWRQLQENGVDLEVHMSRGGHTSQRELIFNSAHLNRALNWLDDVFGDRRHEGHRQHQVAVGGIRSTVITLESWPPPSTPMQLFGAAGAELQNSKEDARDSWTTFIYDASDPTPAVGGNIMALRGSGNVDNTDLESRPDVVVYTSAPLTEDVLVSGHPHVSLNVDASKEFDIFARLCDVSGNKSINVCDEITRFSRGGQHRVGIDLDGTTHLFKRGHRIRLLIAGGAFPRFDINPALRPIDQGPHGVNSSVTIRIRDRDVELTLPTRGDLA